MELDGFNNVVVGLLDNNEQIMKGQENGGLTDSGVFRMDAKSSLGVLNASISGLAPQTTNISGSNEIVGVSGSGTGAITCTLGVNDLPTEIEYRLIGAKKTDAGAWYQDKDTRSPYAAMELTAQGRDNGLRGNDAAHIALLKGQFYVQPQNLRTNNGTGNVNRATDSLQFKAINRHSDSQVIQYGFEKDSEFNLDRFHQDVFPGADFSALSDTLNGNDAGNVTDNAKNSDVRTQTDNGSANPDNIPGQPANK